MGHPANEQAGIHHMTLSPNTQITQENVGLLKAGDWLQCAMNIAGPDVRKYVGDLVQFEKIEHGLIGVCGDFWGPTAFTYIGPDLGDGWIGWGGGENPVPGMRVECRCGHGDGAISEGLSDEYGWDAQFFPIIAFRPALSPPAEGSRPACVACEDRPSGDNIPCAVCGLTTPTPAPADHIGDATEKVDWTVVGPKLVEDISRQLTFERGYGDVRGELLFRCKDLIVAILSEQPCAYLVDAHKGEGEECLVPAAQGDPGSFPVFALAATQPEGK